MLDPRQTPIYEAAEIYEKFKLLRREGKGVLVCCDILAAEYDKKPNTIFKLLSRFKSRTELAQDYLRASAFRMAKRVVTHGDPGHLIDVLSRSNIGVLAPKQEQGAGGGGFFLSVQADSCGAVKIGAAQMPQLPAAPSHALANSPFEETPNEEQDSPAEVPAERFFGKRSEGAIREARERLQQARNRQGGESGAGRPYLVTGGEEDKRL